MKSYIIHDSTNIERKKHIKKQIRNIKFDFDFVNAGDSEDISQKNIHVYFKNNMASISDDGNALSATSCAYKHILAYEYMMSGKIKYAVILEDDIFLSRNFERAIRDVLLEIKERKLSNILISLEDSNKKFVKGSDRKKKQLLYKNKETRGTGAYLIDFEGAINMLGEIYLNKCGLPMELFQNYCSRNKIIDTYWIHPAVAIQGSANGRIASMIKTNMKTKNYFYYILFCIDYAYKKLLWRLK